MMIVYFKAIEVFQKGVNNLKKSLKKCKKAEDCEVIKKRIEEFETIILDFRKITDGFLNSYDDVISKGIIIDHYYNVIKWDDAIANHTSGNIDFNTDTYRKKIMRDLSKVY